MTQIKFNWPWEKKPAVTTPVSVYASSPATFIPVTVVPSLPASTVIVSEPVLTEPASKEAQPTMSFKSVLQTIGSDVTKVFAWIGSPKGQAVITAGEGAVETIAPQLTGLINLANSGLVEIVKIEALAAGAAAQNGTGAQKLTAVVATTTPAILAYAEANGLPVPTATSIQNAINGLVAFANALEGK